MTSFDRIIEAAHARFDACKHENVVEPPSEKCLRVCLGCGFRLIECDQCDANTFARADIADSGWQKSGDRSGTPTYTCPQCQVP